MIDKLRVLAALRAGDVTPNDFLGPDVADGKKPIQRVAARINDLRRDGYGIETVSVRPVATYRLTSSPSTPVPASGQRGQTANGSPSRDDSGSRPTSHVHIDLAADGLVPSGPAWADSTNQFTNTGPSSTLSAIDDTDDGDDSWITEVAA